MNMEESLEATIATYDTIAEIYKQYTQDKQPALEFVRFCSYLPPGGIVLDAGCAWGRDSRELAAKGFQVKGIDLAKKLLALARQHTQDYTSRCEFLEADVRKLPFTNDFFDGIWCCACLLHLERDQIEDALKELKRVIKTNGICAIIVKKGQGADFQPYQDAADTNLIRYFTYFQEDELRDLCVAVGFTVVETNTTNTYTSQNLKNLNKTWIFMLLRKENMAGA